MSPKRFATAAMLIATLLFAACGDDDSGEGVADDTGSFLAAADEICTEAAADVVAINAELGIPETAAGAVELGEEVVESREEQFDELSALEAPSELDEAYEKFLDARIDAIAANEAQIAADEDEDLEASQSAAADYDDALVAADTAAGEAGLTACAGTLPEEVAAELAELAEVGFLAETPEELERACEATTEDFLETLGGLEQCLKPSPVDAVEVLEVTGISEVTAEARVKVSGGSFDGQTVLVFFDYIDDEWKAAGVQPV